MTAHVLNDIMGNRTVTTNEEDEDDEDDEADDQPMSTSCGTYDCGDSRWNSRSIMRREARSGASCVERAVSCLQLSDGSAVRHSPHLG